MPIEIDDLKALIAAAEEREAKAKEEGREQAAEAQAERVERLEAELEALRAERKAEPKPEPKHEKSDKADDPGGDSVEKDELHERRTRPGRKKGQLYQDRPGEPGYIYDGEDEPDEVEINEETG